MDEHPTTELAREIVSDFDAHRPARLTALAPYRNVDLARRLLALEAVVDAARPLIERTVDCCDSNHDFGFTIEDYQLAHAAESALAALDKLKEVR